MEAFFILIALVLGAAALEFASRARQEAAALHTLVNSLRAQTGRMEEELRRLRKQLLDVEKVGEPQKTSAVETTPTSVQNETPEMHAPPPPALTADEVKAPAELWKTVPPPLPEPVRSEMTAPQPALASPPRPQASPQASAACTLHTA